MRIRIAAVTVMFAAVLGSAALAGGNGHGPGDSGGNAGGNGGGNSDKTTVASTDTQSLNASKGSLNASNASATGLANAAPNSTVGQIAIYLAAMTDYSTDFATYQCYVAPADGQDCGNIELDSECASEACIAAQAAVEEDLAGAASALAGAANKPITQEVVDAVNANLGITVDDAVEGQVAESAALLQPAFPAHGGLY